MAHPGKVGVGYPLPATTAAAALPQPLISRIAARSAVLN